MKAVEERAGIGEGDEAERTLVTVVQALSDRLVGGGPTTCSRSCRALREAVTPSEFEEALSQLDREYADLLT